MGTLPWDCASGSPSVKQAEPQKLVVIVGFNRGNEFITDRFIVQVVIPLIVLLAA